MRITLLTIGSTGDVLPLICLGKELTSRGHDITLATFSGFADRVRENGLRFFPLSGDAEAFMNAVMSPETSGLSYLPHLESALRQVAPHLIQDMSDSCSHADALVCSFFGSLNYSIAEKHRIPCIQIHYFPMDPTSDMPISAVRNQRLLPWMNLVTFRLGYLLISTVEKRLLSAWRSENNLPLRKIHSSPDYQVNGHPVPVIYAISPAVLPRPTGWGPQIQMSGFWFDDRPIHWNPPESLETFLAAHPDALYIGFGSMNGGDMQKLLAIVLRALHAAGLHAVIHLGWSGLHLSSTSRVHFVSYVPHDWLFPRVSAVVHHGGAGTTAAGLRFGKPTLVIPFAGDQAFWGRRVQELNCGPAPIARAHLTVNRLTSALKELVSQPAYRRAAESIQRAIARENGVKTAADLIEKEISRW